MTFNLNAAANVSMCTEKYRRAFYPPKTRGAIFVRYKIIMRCKVMRLTFRAYVTQTRRRLVRRRKFKTNAQRYRRWNYLRTDRDFLSGCFAFITSPVPASTHSTVAVLLRARAEFEIQHWADFEISNLNFGGILSRRDAIGGKCYSEISIMQMNSLVKVSHTFSVGKYLVSIPNNLPTPEDSWRFPIFERANSICRSPR